MTISQKLSSIITGRGRISRTFSSISSNVISESETSANTLVYALILAEIEIYCTDKWIACTAIRTFVEQSRIHPSILHLASFDDYSILFLAEFVCVVIALL